MRWKLKPDAPSVAESGPPPKSEPSNPTLLRPNRSGQPFNPFKQFTGTFIPEAVCRHKGLSPNAKLVYGRLCRFAGKNGRAYPAVETLAKENGIGKTQARRALRELQASKFIKSDGKHYRTDGSGGTTVYVFLWHEAFDGELGAPRKAARKTPPNRTPTTTPPQRRIEGVPQPKAAPPTPTENRTQKESGSHHQESDEENHTAGSVEFRPVVEIASAPKNGDAISKSGLGDDEPPKTVPERMKSTPTGNPVMGACLRGSVMGRLSSRRRKGLETHA